MKKKLYFKLCYILSSLLAVTFPIVLISDYITYKSSLNSAPFYVWIIIDSIYFLVPALILFIIGTVLKKKVQNTRPSDRS